MILRMALKSASESLGRLLLGVGALALSGLAVSTGAALVDELGPRLGRGLSGLGPNVLFVAPPGGRTDGLPPEAVARLAGAAGVGVVPLSWTVLRAPGPVPAVGTDLKAYRRLNAYMHIEGRWPAGPHEVIAGIALAQRLGLAAGHRLTLGGPGATATFVVAATAETGDEDDDRILVDRVRLATLTGQDPAPVQALAARLEGDEAAVVVGALQLAARAGVEARPVRSALLAQGLAYHRARTIVPPLLALILATAGLTVLATWTSLLIARREEVALLVAIGWSRGAVARLFLTEATVIAAAAGLCGALLGLPVARALGTRVFAVDLAPGLAAPAMAVGVVVLLAALSVVGPIARALAANPAVVLRGE